jgi:hypothetical protein
MKVSESLGDQPSSAGDSPASLTALQENVKRLVMTVTSGHNSRESFAKLNPDGSWVKTSQGSVQVRMDGSLEEYSETWPRWGIVLGGVAGKLPISEHHIIESGFSLLPTTTMPLMPKTLTDHECEGGVMEVRPNGTAHYKLRDYIAMLPTLNTCDATMGTLKGKEFVGTKHAMKLEQAINLLPTPIVCGNYNREGASKTSGNGLATAIKLLPTVTANTGKNTSLGINFDKREAKCHLDGVFMNQIGKKSGLRLQPAFAEWMMGFPIGWTDLPHLEMPSSRNKSIRSSKRLPKLKEECK